MKSLQNPERKCSHCGTKETTVWRRGAEGQVLCNACQQYAAKNRGNPRPQELWHTEIKKRQSGAKRAGGALPHFSPLRPSHAAGPSTTRNPTAGRDGGQQIKKKKVLLETPIVVEASDLPTDLPEDYSSWTVEEVKRWWSSPPKCEENQAKTILDKIAEKKTTGAQLWELAKSEDDILGLNSANSFVFKDHLRAVMNFYHGY